MYQAEGNMGYLLACAAAVQNMLLAAHALGLGSLFFTMFDKANLRTILNVPEEKTPVALVCIGKVPETLKPVPRKDITALTRYLD
jgi:nitroreductase